MTSICHIYSCTAFDRPDKSICDVPPGINEEMAKHTGRVDLPQMVKLAETNQLVCHFRFDDHQTIQRLTQIRASMTFYADTTQVVMLSTRSLTKWTIRRVLRGRHDNE